MSLRIDVEKSFLRSDNLAVQQPPDYTDFRSGEPRISIGTLQGAKIIPQEGLMKRKLDAKVITAEQKQNWVSNGSVGSGNVKPVKNIGVLSYVDKFFLWLNKMLGEK